MLKRIKQEKRPADVNELAHHFVEDSTRENGDTLPPTKEQISRFMAEMGRKGGKKGGKTGGKHDDAATARATVQSVPAGRR